MRNDVELEEFCNMKIKDDSMSNYNELPEPFKDVIERMLSYKIFRLEKAIEDTKRQIIASLKLN